MFSLTSSHRYHLYRGYTDMRKSFDGLSGIVQNQLGRNPASGEVFIFINRPRNRIKLLHWEYGGFTLYYKRLETGTFELPSFEDDALYCTLPWHQLVMMVDGISMRVINRRRRFINTEMVQQQII
jgi:transposase